MLLTHNISPIYLFHIVQTIKKKKNSKISRILKHHIPFIINESPIVITITCLLIILEVIKTLSIFP